MSQLELQLHQQFWWQWHGREIVHEKRGAWNEKGRLKRVVYHIASVCKAPDERSALRKFESDYPHAKTGALIRIGPVKSDKPKRR